MPGMPDMGELRAQGAISLSPRGGWRPGWLTLRSAVLTFAPPGARESLRIDLEGVSRVTAEWRKFVVSAKPVVRLTYLPGQASRSRTCWLITAKLDMWEAAFRQRAGAAPDPALPPCGLAAALTGLTGAAGLVVDYLAYRGYATTAELMDLTGAETEEALPRYLSEVFGGVDQALGGAAIRYVGVHFDQWSRKCRHQSWRLDEVVARTWLAASEPPDVLRDGDDLMVVTSLPTQARGASLTATVAPDGRGLTVCNALGYRRWIALGEEVAGAARCVSSATGTLTIRVRRRTPAASLARRGGIPQGRADLGDPSRASGVPLGSPRKGGL